MVNQLAAAHEREIISSGSSLHLTVDWSKSKSSKDVESETPGDGVIKLQLVTEGKNKVDLNFDFQGHEMGEDSPYF